LYGRNTFGGNIAVVLQEPKFDALDFSSGLTGADHSRYRGEGMVNVPVSDTFALRIAAAYEKSDGYVENSFNKAADQYDEDTSFVRLSALFKPTEELKILARFSFLDQGGNGGGAFGYKQAGTFFHSPSCQQLFNATPVI